MEKLTNNKPLISNKLIEKFIYFALFGGLGYGGSAVINGAITGEHTHEIRITQLESNIKKLDDNIYQEIKEMNSRIGQMNSKLHFIQGKLGNRLEGD